MYNPLIKFIPFGRVACFVVDLVQKFSFAEENLVFIALNTSQPRGDVVEKTSRV